MAKKPAQKSSLIKTIAIIGATFLIVGGITGIALTADKAKKSIAQPVEVSTGTSTAKILDAVLVVDNSGAKLISIDGTQTKALVWPDDVELLGKPLSQLRGAYVRSGVPAWLLSGFELPTSTMFRSPDGRREVRLMDAKRDGSMSIEITYGRDKRLQALRERNRAIKDIGLVGWADDDSIIFTGSVTGTRASYTADLNGSVTKLSDLPDESWLFYSRSDGFYEARAAAGQGIESPQQPPSSVWYTAVNGSSSALVYEENKVIQSFVPFNSSLLYAMDNGDIYLKTASGTEALGLGRPLLLLSDRTSVWSWDKHLFIRDSAGLKHEIAIDNQESAIFYIPKVKFTN